MSETLDEKQEVNEERPNDPKSKSVLGKHSGQAKWATDTTKTTRGRSGVEFVTEQAKRQEHEEVPGTGGPTGHRATLDSVSGATRAWKATVIFVKVGVSCFRESWIRLAGDPV